jgi:hypothetical protein
MKKTEERQKPEDKRGHRSRYSLNTEYTFGTDSTRRVRAQNEVRCRFSSFSFVFEYVFKYRDLLEHWDR